MVTKEHTLYDLRFHRHYAVVDRRTGRSVYSCAVGDNCDPREALDKACAFASESKDTGYLSVVPMIEDGFRFAS